MKEAVWAGLGLLLVIAIWVLTLLGLFAINGFLGAAFLLMSLLSLVGALAGGFSNKK